MKSRSTELPLDDTRTLVFLLPAELMLPGSGVDGPDQLLRATLDRIYDRADYAIVRPTDAPRLYREAWMRALLAAPGAVGEDEDNYVMTVPEGYVARRGARRFVRHMRIVRLTD